MAYHTATIYWAMGLFGLLLFIMFFISYDYLTKNLKEMFEASIGLLTFTSIFYAFTISPGTKIIENVRQQFIDQREVLKKKLSEIAKSKNCQDISKELKKMQESFEKIDEVLDYLNLNKWLFVSVMGYMTSLACFIVGIQKWVIFIQLSSFWIGFYSTIIIATSWFIANHVYIKGIRK